MEQRTGRPLGPEGAALPGPRRLSVGSWDDVRGLAGRWLSEGSAGQAFRLVMAFRLGQATDESAEFMRRSFRDVPFRFALAMVQGIGNMIMMTPAIRALKDLFPRCEIEVVGHQPALQVLEGWPPVRACTELERFDPARERDAVLLSMWSGQFQKTHPALVSSGDVPAIRVDFTTWLRHEAEFHLDIARALGFAGEMPEPYCATREVPLPFEQGRRVALLADTSNPDEDWQRKRWPHFRELAARLLAEGCQVGLIGGPAEAAEFSPDDWPPGVLDLLGKYSIPETAYLIERADLLIANDSGPAHMGAAVGTETYVLFGPTRESKNLPLGPSVHVISTDMGCRPCQYLQSWQHCSHHRCMERISVDSVLASVRGEGARPEVGLRVRQATDPSDENGKVKVDLGCGRFKRKGFIGIDIDPHIGADIVCDVTQGIPLATDSVDYLAADNLLEHIGDGFVRLMGEVWRVCRPGATVELTVPLFPSAKAVSDPTHRRYFTGETFSYFDANSRTWRQFGASYGFKPFRIAARHHLAGEMEVLMTPQKDAAPSQTPPAATGGKPRVWFVSHNQPGAGGAEIVMHHVANGLARRGYEVAALYNATPFVHNLTPEAPPDTLYDLRWIEGPDLPTLHGEAARAVAREAAPGDVCLPLWRAASSEMMSGCRERGVSVGVWCHNVTYPPERSNRSVFRLADFVVAVTPYARRMLKQRFNRAENVFVVPNACADVFFAGYRDRRRTQLRRFVFFGRLADEQKGLINLCDALAVVREKRSDFTMDIIGSGPDEDLMRSRIGSLGLGENTRLLGWKKPQEVATLLPDYDLCILPSNFEACSLAVIETMAAGVPLITTAVGGTPWLITQKKNGILVPPGRPQQLARAIEWACDHPATMSLMARWAHKRALKRYHWDRVVRDYCELFARVQAAHSLPQQQRMAG